MKHLLRRPVLPALFLALVLFAACFLGVFQKGIQQNRTQLAGLYDNTVLSIELLPAVDSDGKLQFPTHKGGYLDELPQVSATLRVMECNARVGETQTRVYGTNDYAWFARYGSLSLTLLDGWDGSFRQSDWGIPCLVGSALAETLGLTLGGEVSILPVDSLGSYSDSAPLVPLRVVGILSDPSYTLDTGIVVPEEIFLYGPRLLYNSNMMYDCFYRTFVLELDPAYNRAYAETEAAVEAILYDTSAYEISSNYRTLRRAVGPLERKLAIQEQLVLPLAALFAAAAVICAVLLARSFRQELFLRRIWGEKKHAVLLRLLGILLLFFSACGIAAVCATVLAAGTSQRAFALKFTGAACLLSFGAAALNLGRASGKNLVEAYQTKEGE